ncbi:MAG: phosphoglucosamine mutase, partial [Proteobacteria bacterium]|nr:phosphoglucosamine mutase [Pseudomonadota bacterium]
PVSEVGRLFEPVPQFLRSVQIIGTRPLQCAEVKKQIRDAELSLGDRGRLLIRESGTEPVIRIMAEGEDEALVGRVVDNIAEALSRVAG